MARLLWRDAQGIEGSLDLAAAEIHVGRAMECAIRTDDAMVSRHHARVYWTGAGFVIEDLGSANGVYFQEQRVGSHRLSHGDAVRCGSLWLRYVDEPGVAVPVPTPPTTPQPGARGVTPAFGVNHPITSTPPVRPSEADLEIRVLGRRLEQLQTELRVYRTNKFNQDTARRMEDLEADVSTLELERDQLKARLAAVEQQLATEGGDVHVRRAIEIAATAAETTASLHDLLSGLRIEVMAARGEFDQFSGALPRASFELIRQSLIDAAAQCDQARDLLRRLRELVNG